MKKRISKKAPPIDKLRKKALGYISAPYKRLSNNQKFWIGFVLLSVFTTLLINNPFLRSKASEYKEGEIARESVISPADITTINEKETQQIKEAAVATVKPIFNYESGNSEKAVQKFRSAWESLQRSTTKKNSNTETTKNAKWTGAGGEELGKIFSARKFSSNEVASIVRILGENSKGAIYDDKDRQFLQNEVDLIDREQPNETTEVSRPGSTWIPLSQSRLKLETELKEIESLSKKEIEAFDKALEPLILPSVVYDSAATAKAKQEIVKDIEPIKISLKRGQTIVREGDVITSSIVSQLEAIRSYSNTSRKWNRFFGLLLIITALFWIGWKFIEQRGYVTRLDLSVERTFALFGFIILIQVILMAISFRIADFTAIQNETPPLNDPTLWALAIPFAFPSLLMNLLADKRTALFTGLFSSFIAGLLAPKGLEFAIYSLVSSAVAVYGIGRYRSRQSVTIAGLMIGAAGALTAVALLAYTQQPFILNTILLAIGCGVLGGLVAAAVTAVFLPICETLFGILTDVKLLELSNMDLPILGQLALRAPGTNQHSLAVGQLSEQACKKVGANGLLAKIGALYHDIGKTAAPEHFVENQSGVNPHDRLKPAQSAKIIISHVTYGIKLGKEMGLPDKIIDFIPQHHGTRTLHYFLTKAQEEAGKNEMVVEEEFRYPGPKPQFKEAAIMMIADSCEAAARSLSDPSAENIRFVVTKIIDAILADDQLDECDLSLRELTQIRESMIKSLVSIYHKRIDYPGYTPPSKSIQNIIIPKELDSEERGLHLKAKDIPISKGGEIEDEAVHKSKQPTTASEGLRK